MAKLSSMTLAFHQGIFDLMGNVSPEVEPMYIEVVRTIEKSLGLELPESVKEWLLIKNKYEIFSNLYVFDWLATEDDFIHPIKIEGLSKKNQDLVDGKKIIPVFKEKGGQFTWSLNLQNTDPDPKIVLHVKDFPSVFISHPHRFAKQIYLSVWDSIVMMPSDRGYYLKAEVPYFGDEKNQKLRSVLNEISTTFLLFTNETTYRFHKADTFLCVEEDGNTSKWHLHAKSVGGLKKLLIILKKIPQVYLHLKPAFAENSSFESKLKAQAIQLIQESIEL